MKFKLSFVVCGIGLLGLLSLTGCAGAYTNQANQQLRAAGQREMAAWAQVGSAQEKECPRGTDEKPIPRQDSLKQYECFTRLIEQYVRPVAFNSIFLSQFLAEVRQFAIDYKKGKLDRDEANQKNLESYNAYLAKLDAQANQQLQAASQYDAQLAQQRQQAIQNMTQQLQQQQAIQAQQAQQARENMPRTTNCHMWNNTMTCTEF